MEVNEDTSTAKYISGDVSKCKDEEKADMNDKNFCVITSKKPISPNPTDSDATTDKKETTDTVDNSMSNSDMNDADECNNTQSSDNASTPLPNDEQDSSNNNQENIMSDAKVSEEVQHPIFSPLDPLLDSIFAANKADIVTSSLKQIAKLLQNVAKKPSDKKARQIRVDNIIIKKYVTGVENATQLLDHLGFVEETIDGKVYKSVSEDFNLIPEYNNIANYITEYVYTPTPTKTTSPETKDDNKSTETNADAWITKNCLVSGCPFFGTQATKFMCSVCYENSLKNSQKETPKPQATTPSSRHRLRMALLKVKAVCRFKRITKREEQIHKDRCWSCKRKLGLSGTECRCGYIFCGIHRYADEHNCTFDHYARHQAALEKANQKVKSKKFSED